MSHPRLQAEPSRGLPLRLQLKTVIFPWLQCGKWLWSSNMGPVFPTQQSCFSVNCLWKNIQNHSTGMCLPVQQSWCIEIGGEKGLISHLLWIKQLDRFRAVSQWGCYTRRPQRLWPSKDEVFQGCSSNNSGASYPHSLGNAFQWYGSNSSFDIII